ncbi:MAG: TadE/TadG family type IV pilus assembly protein [Bifidobacteriaceae bacterium]|nr:TadE/TadG family type IV pilus assembly protein [Bifidobacteriaceae bacterium]
MTASVMIRNGLRLHKNQSGTVTAEFAVVLPAVIAVVVLVLMLFRASSTGISCQDAANVAAHDISVSSENPPDYSKTDALVASMVSGAKANVEEIGQRGAKTGGSSDAGSESGNSGNSGNSGSDISGSNVSNSGSGNGRIIKVTVSCPIAAVGADSVLPAQVQGTAVCIKYS